MQILRAEGKYALAAAWNKSRLLSRAFKALLQSALDPDIVQSTQLA